MFSKVVCVLAWLVLLLPYRLTQIQVLMSMVLVPRLLHSWSLSDLQFYNRIVIVIIAIIYRKAHIFKGLKPLAKEESWAVAGEYSAHALLDWWLTDFFFNLTIRHALLPCWCVNSTFTGSVKHEKNLGDLRPYFGMLGILKLRRKEIGIKIWAVLTVLIAYLNDSDIAVNNKSEFWGRKVRIF